MAKRTRSDKGPGVTIGAHTARTGRIRETPSRSRARRAEAPRPPREPRTDAVRGYSATVRFLRIGLPLAALAVLVGVFLSGRSGPQSSTELIFRTGQFAALQTGLRLTNPRFTGATSAGEPFLIRADWAEPDGPDPELVDLNAVSGEIVLADGRKATLNASEGELAPKGQTVLLTGGVSMATSDGYTMTTETMRANARERLMVSDGAVQIRGPMGELSAGRLRIEEDDGGGVIWFEEGVTARLVQVAKSRATGE